MNKYERKQVFGRITAILLLLFVSMIIYANSIRNGFVNDDDSTIVNNTLIKEIGNIPKLFEKYYFTLSGENSYRPFVTFTYFLDYSIFDLSPWGFHLTNILLHALNGIFLYLFLTLLIGTFNNGNVCSINKPPAHLQGLSSRILKEGPLLTALMFVMQPALTEAVNAISFREDLLVTSFYMATLNLYLIIRSDFRVRRSLFLYVLSCLTYSIALLSKEMAVTLPVIVYCCEGIYKDKKKSQFSVLANPYNIGYIAITLTYIYIRFYYFYNPGEEIHTWGVMERILTVPWLLMSYIKLILFPVTLSSYYEIIPPNALIAMPFILSFILLLSLFLMARKFGREMLFGLIFFIVTLIPVYNLIPIINPFAERYIYLPTIGFTIFMGIWIHFILLSLNAKYKHVSVLTRVPFILTLCILVVLTVKRNEVWKDMYTLWSDAARKNPKNNRAHYNLGTICSSMGRVDEAIFHYQAALGTDPDDPKVHNNLANIYSRQGQYGLATLHYQLALKQNHSDPKIYFNLGTTYGNQGKFREAAQAFQDALNLTPITQKFTIHWGSLLKIKTILTLPSGNSEPP